MQLACLTDVSLALTKSHKARFRKGARREIHCAGFDSHEKQPKCQYLGFCVQDHEENHVGATTLKNIGKYCPGSSGKPCHRSPGEQIQSAGTVQHTSEQCLA